MKFSYLSYGYVQDVGILNKIRIDEQQMIIQQWGEKNGYLHKGNLVDICSEGQLLMDRSNLLQYLAFIQPGSVMIVYDIDYIYTCREDYLKFTEVLDAKKIRLYVLNQNLNNFDHSSNYLLSKCILQMDQKRRLTPIDSAPKDLELEVAKVEPTLILKSETPQALLRYVGRKCRGYIRVSTKRQADKGLSLQTQEGLIKEWAARNRCVLLSFGSDKGTSGKILTKLKGLNTLIASFGEGELLVVENMTRLIRSPIGYRQIMTTLIDKKCGLISIREGLHVHTLDDVLATEGYIDLAAHEIANISCNVKTVLDYKSGVSNAHSTPFEKLLQCTPEQIRSILKLLPDFRRICQKDVCFWLKNFPSDVFEIFMDELDKRHCIIAEDDESISSEDEYEYRERTAK